MSTIQEQHQTELESTFERVLRGWIHNPPRELVEFLARETERLNPYLHRELLKDLVPHAAPFLSTRLSISPKDAVYTDLEQLRPKGDEWRVQSNHEGGYKDTSPKRFWLFGEWHHAYEWRTFVQRICTLLYERDSEHFDAYVVHMGGARRHYFSKNIADLNDGRKVGDSDWYVETNLSANNSKHFADKLVRYLGYGTKLEVEV